MMASKKTKNPNVAFLVPAHNEDVVIEGTLKSILEIANTKDVYLVDDGSKDSTSKVAKKFTKNVYTIKNNVGKATALNKAIQHFKLTSKYKYIMPLDADTRISPNFLDVTVPILENDKDKKYACVVGKVTSRKATWITKYRSWEYEVSQAVHKQAQAKVGSIIVCPGCSTLYRSDVFKKIKIPTGTLTEDMDLTFLMHRKKIGQIAFTSKAYVMTQDPKNLKDFMKQIDRWYIGFWQCVQKHNIPWEGQMLDFEVGMLALEALFGVLTIFALVLLLPFILAKQPNLLIAPIGFDFLFFILPTLLFTTAKNKLFSLPFYIPHLYLMRFLSSLIFFRSFLKVVLGYDLAATWGKASRYLIGKEKMYGQPVRPAIK